MAELKAMVEGAQAGKHSYLVFSLSSHGTQIPDRHNDEPDNDDEALCPTDLAAKNGLWDLNHIILDDELQDLFAQVPDNVLVEVYLDTCHSGPGLRAVDLMPARRPRYLAPPSVQATERVQNLVPRRLRPRITERVAKNVILWAACRANQTSSDAYIDGALHGDGAYHGAFTDYWVKEITAANNKISRNDLLKKVNQGTSKPYSQDAQLECPAT